MSRVLDAVVDEERGLFDVETTRETTVVFAMLALDVLWWKLTYDGDVPMPGMEWVTMGRGIPMAAPGAMELGVFHVGTFDAVLGYLTMWGVMMWAMMQPAMVRFTRDYAVAHDGSNLDAAVSLTSFLTSYHLVWALSGVIPLLFHAVLPGGIHGFTQSHTTFVVGGVLVLTGCYQLSTFKQSLLRSCCEEVDDHDDGIVTAFEEGLRHGTRCILICFGPFFLVMPFFGETNVFWMVVLTGVVTVERLPSWGREIAISTGVISLLAGLLVLIARPDLPVAFTMSV